MLPFLINETFDKSSNFSKPHFLMFKNEDINICTPYFMTVCEKHDNIRGGILKMITEYQNVELYYANISKITFLFQYKYVKVHYIV